MQVFYRKAIVAATIVEGPPIDPATIPNLADWPQVADVLNRLTSSQKCHAIYADWLLQIHSPAGPASIQLRDLLLGQGALAANYLAELAQNADDAGAKTLNIAIEDGWLFVANNGRSLSSLNLLGLCRFFIHSNGQVVGLTPDTIGQFGIGFKSCHRVAEEVLVWTWDAHSEWGFRLPISQSVGEFSRPNRERLKNVVEALRQAGAPIDEVRPPDQLGHCTPESIVTEPDQIPVGLLERARQFKKDNPENGIWFALRLRDGQRKETENRIQGQLNTVYELCPLFLNHLRTVTVQNQNLKMVSGKTIGKPAGTTSARRVTLEITNDRGETRRDRFITLAPSRNPDWKVALPADSDFRLKNPTADRFSIRSGGAYAYFPLPALDWPWHVHLHIAAPTNLARSDWNPSEHVTVTRKLAAASQALAEWTTINHDLWHSSWQPCDLLPVAADRLPPGSSPRVFADAFTEALNGKDAFRTLWGELTQLGFAIGLSLEPGDIISDSWQRLAAQVPEELRREFPLVLLSGAICHLTINRVTTSQAKKLFDAIRKANPEANAVFWKDYVRVVLGTDPGVQGGYSRAELIQDAIGCVTLDRPDLQSITLAEAANTRFAVKLTDDWHEFFRSLSIWLGPNRSLAGLAVFGTGVGQMLRSLAYAVEFPTAWDEVARMTQEEFQRAGDGFWSTRRPECPAECAESAIRAIWVESGNEWLPLSQVWVGDEPVAMLKNVIQPLVQRAQEYNDNRRRGIAAAINRWSLRDCYGNVLLARLNDLAEAEFSRRLNEDNPVRTDRLKMLILADNWRPDKLPLPWQEPVSRAAKSAIVGFCRNAGFDQIRGKTLLVGNGDVASILSFLPNYHAAPEWLVADALPWFRAREVLEVFGLKALQPEAVTVVEMAKLGKELLAGYRHWKDADLSTNQIEALRTLFRDATGNWAIGYPGSIEKRLNEHCNWLPPQSPALAVTPFECIVEGNDNPTFGCAVLDPRLAHIPELRAKTIPLSEFKYSIPESEDDLDTLVEGEIPESMLENSWFLRLRELRPDLRMVSFPGRPRLSWTRGQMELTISGATFGLCKRGETDAIFIADSNRIQRPDPPHDPGVRYLPVLVAYTQVAPDDRLVANAVRTNRGLAKTYREHRSKIKARLVQTHATEMGYEAQHVMRELLQNAESAYASRHPDRQAAERSFQVTATDEAHGSEWAIKVTHSGRAFNESDCDDQDRSDDIARLCALAAPQNHNPEEVGRFNRGFKAVFQVTDSVRVVSGGYEFTVEDLLLLTPPDPQPDPNHEDSSTSFFFKVEAAKVPLLFREEKGKPRPFQTHELVFLRHVSSIDVRIDKVPQQSFTLHLEESPLEGWMLMRIFFSSEKMTNEEQFWVAQKRLNSGERVAVALSVSREQHLPQSVPMDLRRMYRTFPLQQHAEWIPFLINADFITEQGRAGLVPNSINDQCILEAVRMVFALVRNRVETSLGNISTWVSWINWLDRSNLNRGADAMPSVRDDYLKVLREFDEWISDHLPDGTGLKARRDFIFPSRLLRRIAKVEDDDYALLRFDTTRWIAEGVADALAPYEGSAGGVLQLQSEIARLISEGTDKERLRITIEKLNGSAFSQDGVSKQEIDVALGLLARHQVVHLKELLELTLDGYSPELDFGEAGRNIEVTDIVQAWNGNEEQALSEFSLDGWMGKVVFEGVEGQNINSKRSVLCDTAGCEGQEAWFRLLCLGSLLGARALPRTVHRFWDSELVPRGIMKAGTGKVELSIVLGEISHRAFGDLDATGENAEMWRRVFYDFEKIRLFVFQDDLPGAFLEHVSDSSEWDAPINFLKNGFRKHDARWTCAIGQSMTAPLFWVMRELRRVGVIKSDAFDASCYYINGPARRAACQLGWIDEAGIRAFRFEELLVIGKSCHDNMLEECPGLVGHFDLPLQWYAFSNPR